MVETLHAKALRQEKAWRSQRNYNVNRVGMQRAGEGAGQRGDWQGRPGSVTSYHPPPGLPGTVLNDTCCPRNGISNNPSLNLLHSSRGPWFGQ